MPDSIIVWAVVFSAHRRWAVIGRAETSRDVVVFCVCVRGAVMLPALPSPGDADHARFVCGPWF
jgi:hypothetical protein